MTARLLVAAVGMTTVVLAALVVLFYVVTLVKGPGVLNRPL